LYCSLAFIALFLVQILASRSGWVVADMFSYDSIDPDHLFARLSVHHMVQMLVALAVITVLSKLIKADFGLGIGDSKKGIRYFLIFTAVIAVIALIYHILAPSQVYGFPLTTNNVLGTLSFQLFLSGTSEEILYRALPVTVLVYVFGKNIQIKGDITLEVVLASLLFTVAHIKWSLVPFSADFILSQLFYAFAMGIVNGIVYQQSCSVLYPMLMHSTSNVLMVGTGYLFALLL
ncbi:MAG: CPBP family intramembrane metalloprotease, partial [Syntrophomonadaceae bacterium]|nr:CPBP family intramembrane metalloprotease [Syntrophomonadaceae bacterium]